MLLNLLNLYSLIFALFSKIEGMSEELDNLKPILNVNASVIPDTLHLTEKLSINIPTICTEVKVSCAPHKIYVFTLPTSEQLEKEPLKSTTPKTQYTTNEKNVKIEKTTDVTNREERNIFPPENLIKLTDDQIESTVRDDEYTPTVKEPRVTQSTIDLILERELNRLRLLSEQNVIFEETSYNNTAYDNGTYYNYEDESNDTTRLVEHSQYDITEKNIVRDLDTSYSHDLSDITYSDNFTMSPSYTGYTFSTIPESAMDELEISNISTSESYDANNSEYGSTESYNTSLETDSRTSTVNDLATQEITTLGTASQSTSSTDLIFDKHAAGLTSIYEWLEATQGPIFTEFDTTLSNHTTPLSNYISCPHITFNATSSCGSTNITQVFTIYNCISNTVIEKICYKMECRLESTIDLTKPNQTNATSRDVVHIDEYNRETYNLTTDTKKKLLKLCWETMFGQELVKLTMMDLVRAIF